MTQIKISEYIEALQKIKEEHGDLGMFEYNDFATISKVDHFPKPQKIYSQKWLDTSVLNKITVSSCFEIITTCICKQLF
jgi:hypothetical protein